MVLGMVKRRFLVQLLVFIFAGIGIGTYHFLDSQILAFVFLAISLSVSLFRTKIYAMIAGWNDK